MIATKDQERKALAQIKKIVDDLGENSYIAIAFEGVWELAEENIESDFGNSCAWYIKKAADLDDLLKNEIDSSNEKERRLRNLVKETEAMLEAANDAAKKERDTFAKKKAQLSDELEYALGERDKYIERCHIAESCLEKAEYEIIRLKAKLFDLMFKGD